MHFKKKSLICVMVIISFIVLPLFSSTDTKLTDARKAYYKKLAGDYILQLWTNDYAFCKASVYIDGIGKSLPHAVRVKFTCAGGKISFAFKNPDSDYVVGVNNTIIKSLNRDHTPVWSNRLMAEQHAERIANIFGVSNLWDKTCFELRNSHFTRGVWGFDLTALKNGFPTLHGPSISIADMPNMGLVQWNCTLDRISSDLSTNVVLTAQQSQKKAWEYLNKYYPHKNDIKHMSFNTNRVEYVTPNYNFIRENAMDEFWDGGCTNPPSLVWKNYFNKHSGFEKGMPVVIYVDAETGEMLGGM